MGNSASNTSSSTEYRPSEAKFLVLVAKNVPLYGAGPDGIPTAEITVEISMGDRFVSTRHVFPSSDGEAVFQEKWLFKLQSKVLQNPFVIKVKDRKLGVLGTYELPIEHLRHYPGWDINIPTIHWTFVPKSHEIDRLTNTERWLVLNSKPCELEFSVAISRLQKVKPQKINRHFWQRALPPLLPKPLPAQRTRRWVVADTALQELRWNVNDIAHEWTAMSIAHRVNFKQPNMDSMHRQNPNRQAFLRRQSQFVDNSKQVAGAENSFISLLLLASPAELRDLTVAPVSASVSAPESSMTPLIENANQRFVGRERSLTNLLDAVLLTDVRPVGNRSVWRSLPNLVLENLSDPDGPLAQILSRQAPYYRPMRNPVIRTIQPRRVPIGNTTTITITGQNLGESAKDVIQLLVCGQNCLGSMEYLSRMKLRCKTKPFIPGSGTVTVITKSGGRSHCHEVFEFYDPVNLGHIHKRQSHHIHLSSLELLRIQEAALEEELTKTISSVVQLELYNTELKDYLNEVEAMVEENSPEIMIKYRDDVEAAAHQKLRHHHKTHRKHNYQAKHNDVLHSI